MAGVTTWVLKHYRQLRPFIFLVPCVAIPLILGATWLSGVSVLLGLLLFISFVIIVQPRHYEPAWQAVAEQANLKFVPSKGRQNTNVDGVINGRMITLTAKNPLPKWNQTAETEIKVSFSQKQQHHFSLTSTNRREREARQLYQINSGIGIPKLDALFVFQNQTKQLIDSLFTKELTNQLVRIGDSDTVQKIEITPTHLCYTAQAILLKQSTLLFLIQLMSDLAERVETAVVK